MDLALQEQMIALMRAFGLHKPDETPCGQPVPVAEAHALMALTSSEPLSQNELAKYLCLEKSTVSRLVSQLQKRGWIMRERSGQDRRMMELRLTESGRGVAAELAEARRVKFQRITSKIPLEQRADVIEALSILVEAMRKND